ncbi:hypothetical protein AY599_09945 [Leptolyngbya valderiana BDU 20041]|nr:hypothetical protein AY599_09945 [Leptolyngbya valderiana BDU 20041]
MTVTMLLDLGATVDPSGGERRLGRFALAGFAFDYAPQSDAERPIELRAQLPDGTPTGEFEELRDHAVPIPDATLSLSLESTDGAAARPLVDLTLSDARVDSISAERLVLRGAKVTAGSATGLIGALAGTGAGLPQAHKGQIPGAAAPELAVDGEPQQEHSEGAEETGAEAEASSEEGGEAVESEPADDGFAAEQRPLAVT